MKTDYIRKNFIGLYLAALFLIGLGYIATLPPYEGFDETAHFSRLREVGQRPIAVLKSDSYLDRFVTDYSGPVAFSSGTPPFDSGNVYEKFYSSNTQNEFQGKYWSQSIDQTFRPSEQVNWQNQHPPLYYLLLAPLTKLPVSFIYQIVSIRVVSYLIALVGVLFGLLSIKRLIEKTDARASNPVLIGFLAYPIVFPMFFVEFARIGNDSLCLFLTGILSYLLVSPHQKSLSEISIMGIGVVLGLGLLTKALFLPITAVLLPFLLIRNPMFRVNLKNLLALFVPLAIIGGSWYAYKIFAYHDLGVGVEVMQLNSGQGGFSNFSLFGFLRGLLVPLVTLSWAGTWSLVRLPEIFYIPLIFVGFWLLWAYFRNTCNRSLNHPDWLGIYLFLVIYLGLAVHVLISMALTGLGQSGGWYLHILMPWLAPILGHSIYKIHHNLFPKFMLGIFMIYALFFQLVMIVSDLFLYSGFATKGDDKHFVFSEKIFSLANYRQIFHNLDLIGFPLVGGVSFLIGFGLLVHMLFVCWVNIDASRSEVIYAN